MKLLRRLVPLFAILVILPGCASVTLVKSWKDVAAPGKTYGNILVVGVSHNRQMRQVFEEVMAGELRKRGITATPSYTVTGVESPLSKALVEKAAQATGADAVLTARVVDRKRETSEHAGYDMTSRGVDSYMDWYGMGTVSYATFDMKPVEVTTSTTISLGSDLFDAGTQKRVWAGMTDAVDPQGVITVTRDFAGVTIATLTKEGFIR